MSEGEHRSFIYLCTGAGVGSGVDDAYVAVEAADWLTTTRKSIYIFG